MGDDVKETPMMVGQRKRSSNLRRPMQPSIVRTFAMLQERYWYYTAKVWFHAFLGVGSTLLFVLRLRSLRRRTGRNPSSSDDDDDDENGEDDRRDGRRGVVQSRPGATQPPSDIQRAIGSTSPPFFLWEDRRPKDAATLSQLCRTVVKPTVGPTHDEAFLASMTFADSSLRPPSCPCCQ
jgi:hypothetical protein